MFEHCAAVGARATVENLVAGPERAANSILEIEDGRIVRERDVQPGDPKQ